MPLSGLMILDKPADMSSARAVAKVKTLLGVKKAGHTGTLDPFATGVLICCINQATRLARFFLHGDKTYQAVLRLGSETDTQDATGRVVAQAEVPAVSTDHIVETLKAFEGRQMQLPPVYAALKHKGTPLYKLARQGNPVQKPARSITISRLRLTSVDLPDIGFEVTCSSGTYVRTLCADMGKAIGCGGHMAGLRRTASSGLTIEQATTLADLEGMESGLRLEKSLIPMNTALQNMPAVVAGPALLERIAHGQRLDTDQVPVNPPPAEHLKVLDGGLNLKAVLKIRPDGRTYDYCCVFH